MRHRIPSHSPHARSGIAQIEILTGLIIYTTLLLLLLAIGSASRAILAAHEQARGGAWNQRQQQAAGTRQQIDTRSLGQLLGPGSNPPDDAGLISAEGQGKIVHVLPGLTDRLTNPVRSSWTVSGAWDHDRIRFLQDAGQHPALTPDPQTHRALQRGISIRKWQLLGK